MESARNHVHVKGSLAVARSVCPRCGCHSYYDLRPQIAWCFASGQIEFGEPGDCPEGAIVIAEGPKASIKFVVGAVARNGREHGVLLVPGVPEAADQKAAGDALATWLAWCAEGNGKKHLDGVTFNSEHGGRS